MSNLAKFKRPAPDKTKKVTSVYLDDKHVEFIKAHDINFSALVRDIIESLIRDELKKKK